MKTPLSAWLALSLGLLAATARANQNPEIASLGHDTYALTHWAETGFARNREKLTKKALEDAAAYCAKMHKELKVLSTEAKRPVIPLTGFAYAKVVFKALDPNDPELHTPAAGESPVAAAPASAPVVAAPASAAAVPAPVAVPAAPQRTPTEILYDDLKKLDELRKEGLLTEEEFQAKRKKLVEESNSN